MDSRESLFLRSLRRDAFIMEVGAYEDPALPDDDEFKVMFRDLCEQLGAIFPEGFCAVSVTDAKVRKFGRRVLTGFSNAIDFPQVVSFSPTAEHPRLSSLVTEPRKVVDLYVNQALVGGSGWSPSSDAGITAVAPYFVRPFVGDKPQNRLLDIIAFYERHGSDFFIRTRPFVLPAMDPVSAYDDAYYAAALFVFLNSRDQLDNTVLDLLEAIHISFQLSWGFPTLAKERSRAERELKDKKRAERYNKDLREIVGIARRLNDVIRNELLTESANLVQALIPGRMLDNRDFVSLFDGDDVIWEGDTGDLREIVKHHNPTEDRRSDEAFVAFAVHTLYGENPHAQRSADSMRQSALRIIEERKARHPALGRLMMRALVEPGDGIEMLKRLALRPHQSGEEMSFYALAVRILTAIGTFNPDFTVNLESPGRVLTMTYHDFDDKYDKFFMPHFPLYVQPCFPPINEVAHFEWVGPFVELISDGLQQRSTDDHVSVSSVTMATPSKAGNPYEVRCALVEDQLGAIDKVASLFESVLDGAHDSTKTHNFRRPARALRERLREADLEALVTVLWKGDAIILSVYPPSLT